MIECKSGESNPRFQFDITRGEREYFDAFAAECELLFNFERQLALVMQTPVPDPALHYHDTLSVLFRVDKAPTLDLDHARAWLEENKPDLPPQLIFRRVFPDDAEGEAWLAELTIPETVSVSKLGYVDPMTFDIWTMYQFECPTVDDAAVVGPLVEV
jgi:hypothetical protein